MRSDKNKTIDLTVEQGGEYLDRCLRSGESGENCIILGDCFEALKALPEKSVDLLIADPPYNLDKDFGGSKFRHMNDGDYLEYTDKWVRAVLPLLKDTATVYVCCDWQSSGAVSAVLGRYFKIRNRITWQREKGRGASKNWKNGCEDIWFATVSDKYTFNVDAVKLRRRVVAPYKRDGAPKDWEETADGNFRNTCAATLKANVKQLQHLPVQLLGRYLRALLVYGGEYGAPHSEAREAAREAHTRRLERGRYGARPVCRLRLDLRDSKETRQAVHRR